MSKVVKIVEGRAWAAIVESNDKYYYIDSTLTPDKGLETMVFNIGDIKKAMDFSGRGMKGVDWDAIYTEHYKNAEKMVERHDYLLKNLEEVL